MSVIMFAMLVLAGLLAGALAEFVLKRGGHGLVWDIGLGLLGSLVGSWIFWVLGVSPQAGMLAVVAVAFAGATIPIVAQRKVWPTAA